MNLAKFKECSLQVVVLQHLIQGFATSRLSTGIYRPVVCGYVCDVFGKGGFDVTNKIKSFVGVISPVCSQEEDGPVLPQSDYVFSLLVPNGIS